MTELHTQPAEPTLRLSGVQQGYGRRKVLDGLTIEFRPGVTALVGPNGAGKTTLLQTMTTILPPRRGEISVLGEDIIGAASTRAARRHIGYLPQHFDVDPSFSVREAVAYAAWLRMLPSRTIAGYVDAAVATVDLADRASMRVRRLSGGMRQRVGIACAIVGEPAIVVLDEPTVGLDPEQRVTLRELLRSISTSTVVLSTHLIEDVAAIAGRIVILQDGRNRFDGTLDEFREQWAEDSLAPDALEHAYLRLVRAAA